MKANTDQTIVEEGPLPPVVTSDDVELASIRRCCEALEPLSDKARHRVVNYVLARMGIVFR